MNRPCFCRWAGGVLAPLLLTPLLCGYDLQKDLSEVYVIKIYQTPFHLEINLSNTADLSDGTSMNTSVRAAAETWNDLLETLQFTSTLSATGATQSIGNGRNELVRAATINGDEFPDGALAVTTSYTDANEYVESDIVFSADENWDSYRGNLRARYDIRRVALHELGHALGLDHPDEAAQSVVAIMNSTVSNVDALQSDDITGAQILYGAPGFTPANDAFASAVLVNAGASGASVTGSNINASRESAEPAHVDVPDGHSVWWRWIPATSSAVRVDTLGSDFDTVLAVYTGSTLGTLTLVGENDDEETPDENPTFSRIRTSFVEFNAVAGTTYHIAVDGWGDPSAFPPGSTGNIVLRVQPAAAGTPAFTSSAQNASAEPGTPVTFTVAFTGDDPIALQWQRIPARGGIWEDLTESATYAGVQTGTLTIQTTANLNGDRFRCIATNPVGTATSPLHTLTVNVPGSTSPSRIVNLSVRSPAGSGDQTLIMGFVVSGSGSTELIARGVGPTLTALGFPNAVTNPRVRFFNAVGDTLAENDDWQDTPALRSRFNEIGAFALEENSGDAVLELDLPAGGYTAHLSTQGEDPRVALIELYSVTGSSDAELSNVSARSSVGTGSNVLIAGFVLEGDEPKTLLIRGIGPSLIPLGVPAATVMADPQVQIFPIGSTTVIASSDDWGGDSTVVAAAEAVGAFPLTNPDSLDAALVITLEPGVYSALLSGVSGDTGVALIEVYAVP